MLTKIGSVQLDKNCTRWCRCRCRKYFYSMHNIKLLIPNFHYKLITIPPLQCVSTNNKKVFQPSFDTSSSHNSFERCKNFDADVINNITSYALESKSNFNSVLTLNSVFFLIILSLCEINYCDCSVDILTNSINISKVSRDIIVL